MRYVTRWPHTTLLDKEEANEQSYVNMTGCEKSVNWKVDLIIYS